MAGAYPDPPAPRMAYDRDGTVVVNVNSSGSSITTMTNTQLRNMNDESASTQGPQVTAGGMMCFIFPELRSLSRHFQAHASTFGSSITVESSTDTTNGFDGTWVTVNASAAAATADPQPAYRSSLITPTGNNASIKAVRFRNTGSLNGFIPNTIHLYGAPVADTNRLELWHPTLNQPLSQTPAYFDFGDMPRNTTVDKPFRIKNLSATLTANTITAGREALTDSAGTTKVSELSLSYNGGAFGATASLASLGPGAISQTFTLRNAPGAASVLGLWSQRLFVSAASWT